MSENHPKTQRDRDPAEDAGRLSPEKARELADNLEVRKLEERRARILGGMALAAKAVRGGQSLGSETDRQLLDKFPEPVKKSYGTGLGMELNPDFVTHREVIEGHGEALLDIAIDVVNDSSPHEDEAPDTVREWHSTEDLLGKGAYVDRAVNLDRHIKVRTPTEVVTPDAYNALADKAEEKLTGIAEELNQYYDGSKEQELDEMISNRMSKLRNIGRKQSTEAGATQEKPEAPAPTAERMGTELNEHPHPSGPDSVFDPERFKRIQEQASRSQNSES